MADHGAPPPPPSPGSAPGAVAALERAAYLLDRALAPAAKPHAFLRAAEVVADLDDAQLGALVDGGRLQELAGVGPSTAAVIAAAWQGATSPYLEQLEATTAVPLSDAARPYREALRGDCHLHSRWSDGSTSIEAMAAAARALGHDWVVLTDHSARLTVAHGLDRDRLLAQLEEVAALNERLAPFRILTGMEVDIFEDGSLDLDDDLLARLDVVVASAHSKLRQDRQAMTRRLVVAAANPHVDVLGHCTGRKLRPARLPGGAKVAPPVEGVGPDGTRPEVVRPPSVFDAEIVFAACARFETAVEVNCRPERQDPPDELLALALEAGCLLSVDTDAHAPGQLEWQPYGCEKLARHGVDPSRVINTWSADDLVSWAGRHPTG